jgi:hypothetical protein
MNGMPCLEPTWNSTPRLLVMGSDVVRKRNFQDQQTSKRNIENRCCRIITKNEREKEIEEKSKTLTRSQEKYESIFNQEEQQRQHRKRIDVMSTL